MGLRSIAEDRCQVGDPGFFRSGFETIEHSLTGRPLKDIPLLSQIYILGHSSAGSDMLSPQVNTTNRLDTVHYNMLAKRMRDAGLSTEFWGRIKVYACKGGADSATGQAFTAKFADVMRTRWNYVNCEYFGYTVELAAPTTFELLEGRLTSALEVSDQERLVEMARGSETIKAKLFSPGFKAQMAQYTSQEAKREFLKHWLIRWLQMEKEKKPSSVRQQF